MAKKSFRDFFWLISMWLIIILRNLNKGYSDIFMEPFIAKYSDLEYAYLIELKYISRGEYTEKIQQEMIQDAQNQLDQYVKSDRIQNSIASTKLIKIILIYKGWELIYCEEYFGKWDRTNHPHTLKNRNIIIPTIKPKNGIDVIMIRTINITSFIHILQNIICKTTGGNQPHLNFRQCCAHFRSFAHCGINRTFQFIDLILAHFCSGIFALAQPGNFLTSGKNVNLV